MTHPIVRTALFVPASRPERIPTASQRRGRRDRGPGRRRRASGQDSARALCDFLGTHPQARLWVRINDAATPWHEDDLKALRGRPA